MSIVVYGKPECPECDRTKKELDKRKIKYNYIDLADEANVSDLKLIKSMGYKSVPVIFEDGEAVSLGYLIN